jgi:cutinase
MVVFRSLLVSALTTLAVASPMANPETQSLEARQFGTSANDLSSGACKDVTLIFARGSTEIGNMVRWNGPLLHAQH